MGVMRGNALLSTLIIVAVIGVTATGIAGVARYEFEDATRVEEADVALAAARAGLEDGLLRYRFNPDIELPGGDMGYYSSFLSRVYPECRPLDAPALDGLTSSQKEAQIDLNSRIPTSDTPFYVRVNLSTTTIPGVTPPTALSVPGYISMPYNRLCKGAAYLNSVRATVSPTDIYYDLKIHYREQAIGTLPKQGSAPTPMNDGNLKTYLNNYPDSGTLCSGSPSDQAKYQCILQKELGAIRIPKDESVDITFPTVIEGGTQTPVAYTQFNYAWEAGDGDYDKYGVEVVHAFGGGQKRTESMYNTDKNQQDDIAYRIDTASTVSKSVELFSQTEGIDGNIPERVRLRAIGRDIWLLGWGASPLVTPQPSSLQLRIDSGITTIESIGQYGHTERRLTATINRADKRIINIADFTLFTSAANICVAEGCK